jgi:NTE family protein
VTASMALALQGGGSHGAFTWGVLDRLLEAVDAGQLHISGFSGASAGGINAALCVCGLAQGGPAAARSKLRAFWEGLSQRGAALGNALFGFAAPGLFGFDIDWSPGAILLEAAGLVVSPYTNPFYIDLLAPLIRESLSQSDFSALNAAAAPRLFVSATNVGTNALKIFAQPDITVDALRASACLPAEFQAVQVGGEFYWDGGYLGNPALDPLLDVSDDLLLVVVNPFTYERPPPTSARQILDRLNQITFNASLVQEVSAIEAVNRVLRGQGGGADGKGRYRPIRFHMIRNERFMQTLGFVSKSSTSWELIRTLFDTGRTAADHWIAAHLHKVGQEPSCDVKAELVRPVLKRPG